MRRVVADFGPLRACRPFRRLWVASTLSAVGTALGRFALPLQVFLLTHSPFDVGLLGAAVTVPTLAVGFLGGSLGDRYDRRRLALAATVGAAGVSAAFAAQAFAGARLLWLLYLLAAAQAVFAAVATPARRSFLPGLLGPEQLPAGLALERLSFQVVLTVGPILAGVVAGVAALGLRTCYLLDTVSFAAALGGLVALPSVPTEARSSGPSLGALREGIRFIWASQDLTGAFLADLAATVLGMPTALFPAINAARFHGDPLTLGLFSAAIGLGGLLSAALSAPLGRLTRRGAAMLLAVAAWGAAFGAFALVGRLWDTLLCLALAGAADTVTVVLRGTIVQSVTPERLRGRVTSADYVVGVGGVGLGGLESGALGSATSPEISALLGGVLTVAAAVAIGLGLPSFAGRRQVGTGVGADPAPPDPDPGTRV